MASIKSTLNSAELIDSLKNIASLPSKNELGNRAMPFINIPSYEDWPFKIIYASDGISMETILRTLSQFYHDNPQISVYNRPNIIHVAGKYNVVKTGQDGGKTRDGKLIPKHSFFANPDQTDVFALAYVVQRIQQHTVAARNILFNYDSILNGMSF